MHQSFNFLLLSLGVIFSGSTDGTVFTVALKSRFPNIRGTIWGIPIVRTIIFWGLYWAHVVISQASTVE